MPVDLGHGSSMIIGSGSEVGLKKSLVSGGVDLGHGSSMIIGSGSEVGLKKSLVSGGVKIAKSTCPTGRAPALNTLGLVSLFVPGDGSCLMESLVHVGIEEGNWLMSDGRGWVFCALSGVLGSGIPGILEAAFHGVLKEGFPGTLEDALFEGGGVP